MPDQTPTMEELTSRRRYVPSEIWGDKLDLDRFEDYDLDEVFMSPPSEDQGLCRCCGRHICRNRAIMIAIDGACRGNGGPNARAACGVFGNVGSPFNETWVIDDDKPTSQRAEIFAAILAIQSLQHLCDFIKDTTPPDQVIIKTDSAYLVNSMTCHINKWRSNGFVNAKKKSVANQDLFEWLDYIIFELADSGCQARFWHVPRVRNMPADNLANAALDDLDWKNLGKEELFAGGPLPFECPIY